MAVVLQDILGQLLAPVLEASGLPLLHWTSDGQLCGQLILTNGPKAGEGGKCGARARG